MINTDYTVLNLNELKPKNDLEAAILSGNLDVLKKLVALSNLQVTISPIVLAAALINGTLNTAQYVIENGLYDPLDLESQLNQLCDYGLAPQGIDKYRPSRFEATNRFAIKRDLRFILEHPMYHSAHRENEIRVQLLNAIDAGDVLGLRNILVEHFSEPSTWSNMLSYDLSSTFRGFLRTRNLEQEAECIEQGLTKSQKELILRDAFYAVDLGSANQNNKVGILVALIEYGANISDFKFEQGFEQWAQDNHCEELLELDVVKKNLAKSKLLSAAANLPAYTPCSIQQLTIIDDILSDESFDLGVQTYQTALWHLCSNGTFGDVSRPEQNLFRKHFEKFFPNQQAIEAFTKTPLKHGSTLAWACQNNQVEILSDSRFNFSTNAIELHKLVVEATQAGYAEVVEELIERFVDTNLKDAFRCSKEEIDGMRQQGQASIAQKLIDAGKGHDSKPGLLAQYFNYSIQTAASLLDIHEPKVKGVFDSKPNFIF